MHKDLKNSLKATLIAMADTHQTKWAAVLPWTLLSKNTAFHSELQASPCELVFGENPALPGDLAGAELPADASIVDLLDRLRDNAKRPAAQTTINRNPAVYYPATTSTATHVYLKCQKPTPLSPRFDGPYLIRERLGKSSLKIVVGHYKNGTERTEVHHWKNMHPMILPLDTETATKPTLGRKSVKK